jgi:hypothetical protein
MKLHRIEWKGLWKKRMENKSIKGNVQAMEYNEGGDSKMVKDKGTEVCAEG